MGRSPTIQELESTEDSFRAYLQKLETQLQTRSATQVTAMQNSITAYFQSNKWDNQEFVSGSNADFMQEHDWTLSNLKAVVDAISKAIFGGGTKPDGVTIESSKEISAALGAMEGLEAYIVGKAFEVLSGIIESFGSATSVSFSTTSKDEALGNGFHLWATVSQDAYKSTSFFNNQEIYEYLYAYEVRFSEDEAKQQAAITLTKLYEDQIQTFTDKVESLLSQLEADKITPEQYQSSEQIYKTLIQDAKTALSNLGPKSEKLVHA